MTKQKKLFSVKSSNKNIDMNVDEALCKHLNHYHQYNKKNTGFTMKPKK